MVCINPKRKRLEYNVPLSTFSAAWRVLYPLEHSSPYLGPVHRPVPQPVLILTCNMYTVQYIVSKSRFNTLPCSLNCTKIRRVHCTVHSSLYLGPVYHHVPQPVHKYEHVHCTVHSSPIVGSIFCPAR